MDTQPQVPSDVKKKDDYLFFIDMVKDGLWRNSKYMAEICSVDDNTIAKWKKTEMAIAARKEACKDLLRDMKRRGAVDLKLKEGGVEIEQEAEKHEIRVIIEDYGSKNNTPAQAEGSPK